MRRMRRLSSRFVSACAVGVALFACLAAVRAQESAPEGDHLRVTHSWGLVATYPIRVTEAGAYLAREDFSKILAQIDRRSQEAWDASSGTYHVTASGRDISLFRDRREFVYNNAIIEAEDVPVEVEGTLLLPVRTVMRILGAFEGLQVEPVIHRPTPAPTAEPSVSPTPVPTQAPTGLDPLSENISFVPEVDVRDIVESLQLLGVENTGDAETMAREMRSTARRLAGRRVVVLDPPMAGVPGGKGLGDVEALMRVAQRCRLLLAGRSDVEAVLSYEPGGDPATRRRALTRRDALAVVCLRVDASRFARNAGFRIYVAHEATDPAALRLRGQPLEAASLPASLRYVRWQEGSLALARLTTTELTGLQFPSASQTVRLAPMYALRRADAPGVMVSLGYWNNEADRARLTSDEGVEKTALALARAVVLFVGWVRENGGVAP